jgi:hypothetical protein
MKQMHALTQININAFYNESKKKEKTLIKPQITNNYENNTDLKAN